MFQKIDNNRMLHLSQQFKRFGIINFTELLQKEQRNLVQKEAVNLLDKFAERMDIQLATTDYTPRYMSVVSSELIAAEGNIIPKIYFNDDLKKLLETIAGEFMITCPSKDEEFLISRHEKKGDTHGWHWGDYSFALIWVLLAPDLEKGGLLQCVPHTSWDKSDARIFHYLIENPINTYYFASGDVYFLRTDTTLHRTIPLREDVTRIMLNMTWGSVIDIQKNLKVDDRWWANSKVAAAVSAD